MTPATLEQELQSPGPTDLPVASDPLLGRRSTIFWLVFVAFAVRLALLLVLQTYRPVRMDDFSIASETTNVAASIAWGHGFSSPLNGDPTGPTAWIPPGYTY